jgi:hypothetical protein
MEADGSIVDHTVVAATGSSTIVTLADYNRDATSAPTIPGYNVIACFDNWEGTLYCSEAAAVTETFDECPDAFATPAVGGTHKWDVRESVTFNFGGIRNDVRSETSDSLTPSGMKCFVDATAADGVLVFAGGNDDGDAVPG